MPTQLSLSLINRLHNQTEAILTKAIGEWQLMPHSRFALKPGEKKWSANECLQHLNSYGRYYIPAMEQAIQSSVCAKQHPSAKFSSGFLGGYFTKMMQPKQNGVISNKMKSPGAHAPKSILQSHEVIREFIDQQEKILKLLYVAKRVDLNKTRVPISIAPFIKLKLGDVLSFVIAHNERHVLQAENALKATSENPVEQTETSRLQPV
ncbi:DinB family protein [Foetidibacter luteolus]|uniref:DinB family protein n=1 Tax=Foetidibacter luteolus TaxID=2608880 RepID=UPI00129BCD6D|nr:DinB family protein [Foetidibacter luteolus]